MYNMYAILATAGVFWSAWHNVIKHIFLAIMAIAAIFVICVVLFQPGNSNGVGALGGTTETFLGKNKSKTFEHKMKVLTVICGIIFAVLCVVFAIIASNV